jgi:hypothetical protein
MPVLIPSSQVTALVNGGRLNVMGSPVRRTKFLSAHSTRLEPAWKLRPLMLICGNRGLASLYGHVLSEGLNLYNSHCGVNFSNSATSLATLLGGRADYWSRAPSPGPGRRTLQPQCRSCSDRNPRARSLGPIFALQPEVAFDSEWSGLTVPEPARPARCDAPHDPPPGPRR